MKDSEIYDDPFSGVELHQHNYYLSISIPVVKMTDSVCVTGIHTYLIHNIFLTTNLGFQLNCGNV